MPLYCRPFHWLLATTLLLAGPGLALAVPMLPDLALAAAAAVAPEQETEWYTVEVPVRSREASEREAALGRALGQVVQRASGRSEAPANEIVRRAQRVAGSFVLASEYRPAQDAVDGSLASGEVLAVSFDPAAIDALLAAAGLPQWLGPRPRPMIWLVIDDGGDAGPRLLTVRQLNAARPLAQRGLERGLRLLLPEGNAIEQQAIDRILRLDPAAIAVLSARYGADWQLLGRMARDPGGWRAEWLLAQGANVVHRWSLVDADPQRVLASGADPAADRLAQRASRLPDAGLPEVLEAEIHGIDDAGDWIALAGRLETLPVLRGFEVLAAWPGQVRVRLDLGVDRRRFDALLQTGGWMTPQPPAPGDGLARYRFHSAARSR